MKVEARIKDEWAKLQTMPLSQCEKITLPIETVTFLTNVGLPTEPFLYWGRNVHFMPTNPKISHITDKHYLIIGSFAGTGLPFASSICLKENTGTVYEDNSQYVAYEIETFGKSTSIPMTYLNQNIQSLLLYFITFREHLKLVAQLNNQFQQMMEQKTATRDELRKIVQTIKAQKAETLPRLRASLEAIDSSALNIGQGKISRFWEEALFDFEFFG